MTTRRVVGRIIRAHGIRGECSIEVRTDAPERRFAPGSVLLTEPDRGVLTVAATRPHHGRLLVSFEEVPDRTAAEQYNGVSLVVDVDAAPSLDDPDEFWTYQLEGLTAVTTDGSALGVIDDVLALPGADTLVIRRPDGRELLVPFVAQIVPEVDIAGGRAVIDPPAGLLDLDES